MKAKNKKQTPKSSPLQWPELTWIGLTDCDSPPLVEQKEKEKKSHFLWRRQNKNTLKACPLRRRDFPPTGFIDLTMTQPRAPLTLNCLEKNKTKETKGRLQQRTNACNIDGKNTLISRQTKVSIEELLICDSSLQKGAEKGADTSYRQRSEGQPLCPPPLDSLTSADHNFCILYKTGWINWNCISCTFLLNTAPISQQ